MYLKAIIQSASATDAAVVVTQESPFQLLSSIFGESKFFSNFCPATDVSVAEAGECLIENVLKRSFMLLFFFC